METPTVVTPDRERFRRLLLLGRDTSWVAAQDGSALVAAVVAAAVIIPQLGPARYGAYLGAYGVISPLTGLAWTGVSLSLIHRIIREREDPSSVARASFTLTLAVGIVTGSAALLLGSLLVGAVSTTEFLFLITAELVGSAFVGLSAATVQAVDGYPAAARIRIGTSIIRIGCIAGLAWADILTIQSLGIAMTAAYFGYAMWLGLFRLPRCGVRPGLGRPSRTHQSNAAGFAATTTATSLQSDGDKTALNYFGHGVDAGLYGAAFRLVKFALMPINALDGALFQRFLVHDPNAKSQHLRRCIQASAVTFVVSLGLVAVLWIAAPWSTIILGDEFEESVSILRWLLLFVPIYAISTSPMNALLGLGRLRERVAVYVGSAAVSLALYVALIPSLSWHGAIIGTVAGELFTVVVGWTLVVVFQRRSDRSIEQQRLPAEVTVAGDR
jgi:O-antigen/teichoic acid export membrane protein